MIDISTIQKQRPVQKANSSGLAAFFNRDIKLFSSGMNDRKKERFYSELHVLLTAGVDIRTAFELLESEAEKKEEKLL